MASSRALLQLSSLLLVSFFGFSEARREFLVGGKTGSWDIPSSEPDSFNKWAQASRFQVGDYLEWKYDGKKDSVLQVTREDYANCNISNPIVVHNDGNTRVKLDRSGPFYFISGAKGHCQKGQKMIVVVMSPRKGFMGISPAPSPMDIDGPAVAPSSNAYGLKSELMVMFLSLVVLLLA